MVVQAELPVAQYIQQLFKDAVASQASDIHFEFSENHFSIRYRIDSSLQNIANPPRHLAQPIINHIKILSHLDITEKKLPQDGHLQIQHDNRFLDCRISVMPIQGGESVVIRILDQDVVGLDLSHLGMSEDVFNAVSKLIQRPYGMLVVSGPTGSGKTTTLYSCIKKINNGQTKIMTVEDPVEYEISGIHQTSIQQSIGLSFENTLRSILRHDPDQILIGEIRDQETAQIAVRAALTGHFVFTSLHANDAASSITRLTHLGIEPFLLANTLTAVLAQRLVKKICPLCKAQNHSEEKMIEELRLSNLDDFYKGKGCEACNFEGYKGRMGIFELLKMNEDVRSWIREKLPAERIKQNAIQRGMKTLLEDGKRHIQMGNTTVEELLKYA